MIEYSDKVSELAVLVSSTLSKNALIETMKLDADDFYFDVHKIIFTAIKIIHEENQEVDLLSLRKKLISMGKYDDVGGNDMISSFAKHGSVINIKSVINTILDNSKKRKLFGISDKIKNVIGNKAVAVNEILVELSNDLRNIDKHVEDHIFECEKIPDIDIKNFYIDGNYLKTGFNNLDDIIIGLFKGELIILGARPAIGKSAYALNITRNIAENYTVLFLSLEMTSLQMVLRLISSETKIDQDKIRRGKISEDDFKTIQYKTKELKKLSIIFSDRVFDIMGIMNQIQKLSTYKNIDLVIIDYLQLIDVPGKQDRYIKVGEISRKLKQLAVDYNIPVMALSQLSRNSDDRPPRLKDLRESGNIEQDADVVIFLHHKEDEPMENIRLLVEKNRSGKTGRSQLIFRGNHLRFYDIDYRNKEEEYIFDDTE